MNILDQWEAGINDGKVLLEDYEKDRRILCLIDLIRKKDEALNGVCNGYPLSHWDGAQVTGKYYVTPETEKCREAIALTEQLK